MADELASMQIRNGDIALGRKMDYRKMGDEIATTHRHLVLSRLFTDENAEWFCKVTEEGMRAGKRTQYIAYKELMEKAGVETKHIVEFIHSVGGRSEDEIRRAVQTMQSAEGASTLDTIERLTEALAGLLNVEPTQRPFVVQRLGGLIPVPERVA